MLARPARWSVGRLVGRSVGRCFFFVVGLVVVGWLGRVSTTLHCMHHVLTCRLKRHHNVFLFMNLLVEFLFGVLVLRE